jgi:probable rRNA maturation factor
MATITFRAQGVPNVFREQARLKKWLSKAAKDHGHSIGELNYVLLGDEALLEYNRRYLKHDAYTDVITFDGQTGTGVSGDVLMSLDRIRENAKTFGVPVQLELRRVMVHGLLHLLGHSDTSKPKKAAMRALEDAYLSRY